MRRWWGFVLVVVGFVAGAPACGNNYGLIDPREEPQGDASTAASGASAAKGDGGGSGLQAQGDSGIPVAPGSDGGFPPSCDTTVNLALVSCNGSRSTSLCGGSTGTDLIDCNLEGNPTCVRHCAMGCVQPPAASTNLIASCANCTAGAVEDQWYCGKDVAFPSNDADVVFECVDGRYVAGSVAVCAAGYCHTRCTRTSPTPLPGSCCETTPDN